MEKFYMVWRENDRSPKVRHKSKILAQNEAERLAQLTPNECFYVLEAITCSKMINVLTQKLD